jgi:seryl-tRNA synthetase
MLDIKRIRQNPEELKAAMAKRRNKGADVTGLLEMDAKRRQMLQEAESLKSRRNAVSQEVPKIKKAGGDVSSLLEEMKGVADRIKALDEQIAVIDEQLSEMLLGIPNMPHESVPEGASDQDNIEVRRNGEPAAFGRRVF